MRGCRERLPVLSLLQLAVARHHDDSTAAVEEALRPRHSASLRKPHAERAGVRLDPGHADVRVPVEPTEAAQAQQALRRNDPEPVQRSVEARHIVSLRREENVAIRMLPPELRDVQLPPEEMDDDVECAEARAEVPRPGALDGDERIRTAHVGDQREVIAGAVEFGARDQLQRHGHGCSARTSSFTSAPQPGPGGIVSVPSRISGTPVVRCSRQGTSSTSTSSIRTFGIAAHH